MNLDAVWSRSPKEANGLQIYEDWVVTFVDKLNQLHMTSHTRPHLLGAIFRSEIASLPGNSLHISS
jgi:hypothetical protein